MPAPDIEEPATSAADESNTGSHLESKSISDVSKEDKLEQLPDANGKEKLPIIDVCLQLH